MSTEVPNSPKHDVNPLSDAELRAAVLAEDDEEHHAIASQRKLGRAGTVGLVTGIAGTLVAGGAIFMANAEGISKPGSETSSSSNELPTSNATEAPAASASPSPSSTEVIATLPVTPEAPATATGIEIPAGLSDEVLAQQLIDRISDWGMAGATKEIDEAHLSDENITLTLEQYVDKVVTEKHAQFVQELLPENYETDPQLKKFADGMKEAMRVNTTRYLQTAGGTSFNPKNKEPWAETTTFTSLVDSGTASDERILTINYTVQHNADKNLFGDGTPIKPLDAQAVIKVTELSGEAKITDAFLRSR